MSQQVTVVRQKATSVRCPATKRLRLWVQTALDAAHYRAPIALTVRLVDEPEGLSLNRQYRNKAYATNVLSFPYEAPTLPQKGGDKEDAADKKAPIYLGDLVICMPVVLNEAIEQHKTRTAHTAHLIVHGVLHLLGYDHETDDQAQQMEQIEVHALRQIGIENPYIAD